MIAFRRIDFLGSVGRLAAIGVLALTAACGGSDTPTSNPGPEMTAGHDATSVPSPRVQTVDGGAQTSQRMRLLAAGQTTTAVPAIAAGGGHSLALKSDGTAWTWGVGTYGQLGNNSTANASVPVQVVGAGGSGVLTGVTAIAGGLNHSLALKSDGTVWAWGLNESGALGNNSTANASAPVQVVGAGGTGVLTGVIAIAGGGSHSLALKSDGTVWAWGLNTARQLGNNTFALLYSTVPVQVVGGGGTGVLTGVTAIAGGGYHSLALKSDGTVWAWGHGLYGQLGRNGVVIAAIPVQVMGVGGSGALTGVTAIAGGLYDSLALQSDVTAWAWGDGAYGELGNNSIANASVPVQVVGAGGTGVLTGVIAIAGDGYHSLALKSDGTVWAWGDGGSGQLGNNNIALLYSTVPVQVLGAGGAGVLTGATAIAAGFFHSLALKNDGTVWAWGYGANGQLGNNGTANSSIPVQVFGPGGVGFLNLGTTIAVAPVPVSVVPLDKSATIAFSPGAGSTTPTKYRVVVTNGTQQTASVYQADEVGNLIAILKDLGNGTPYGVSAFAIDSSGAESPPSPPVTVRPRNEPLSVQEAGTNSPPLVFLHGFMSDNTTWDSTINKLGSKYKTYAIPFKSDNNNACEEIGELDRFMKGTVLPATNNAKVILIGHSQGGIVARGYLQFGPKTQAFADKMLSNPDPSALCEATFGNVPNYFANGNAPVAGLITYGAPHNGVGLQDILLDAVTLLRQGSPFMNTINDFTTTGFPLPENLPIVSIVGKRFSISSDDCLVAAASQNLANAQNYLTNARFFSTTHHIETATGVIHSSTLNLSPFCIFSTLATPETQDATTIEKALGWARMQISLGSPADVVVRSPSGLIVSKAQREIWGTDYRQIEDAPDHVTTVVSIPFPEPGSYSISVVPHQDTLPTDTFTLTVEVNGTTTILANQMRIADAPTAPFTVQGPQPNKHPVANAGTEQEVRIGSVVQLDGSASRDPDNGPSSLRYSWKQVSGPAVLLLNSATVKPKFTAAIKGKYVFSLVVNDGQSNSLISTVNVQATEEGT